MSNANARTVLDALGYAGEDLEIGEADPTDFLGRVVLALALAPVDGGRPEIVEGRTVKCARPEGYRQQRLHELYDLAAAAEATGDLIVWG
jgi:hypothetical protein